MKKLSVWSTVKESTIFTFANLGILGKLFLIPMVIECAAYMLQNSLSQSEEITPLALIPMFVLTIVVLLAESMGAPRWIQHYCKPKSSVSFFQLQKTEWTYFKYAIIVFSIIAGIITAGIALGSFLILLIAPQSELLNLDRTQAFSILVITSLSVLFLASLVVVCWVRLFFVFPATALSDSTGLKHAWKQSKPHLKKLIYLGLIILIFTLPASFFLGKANPIFIIIGVILINILGAISNICITKFYKNA